MTRSTILAALAAPLFIVACGAPAAENAAENATSMNAEMEFEDVSSDGLAAPANTPMESESGGAGNTE